MLTKRIEAALANPVVRESAKRMLLEAMRRDPVDAAYDAALVADLLKERMDKMLDRATSTKSAPVVGSDAGPLPMARRGPA